MFMLRTTSEDFEAIFPKIVSRMSFDFDDSVERRCDKIIKRVREGGDKALMELTKRYDGWKPRNPNDLVVSDKEIKKAMKSVSKEDKKAIKVAAERIEKFHKRIFPGNVIVRNGGAVLKKVFVPLDSVGIYSPAGKAAYPSSVLMCAIPAKIAGVKNVYLASPASRGNLNPHIIYAAHISGVRRIFKVGGAQAIAALAFGTDTIPKVDKIVGPGNIFVATAKRKIQGIVGTDIIAGPSEIVIVSDGTGSPEWIALDLLAQAEHDEQALPILICHNEGFAVRMKNALITLVERLPRKEIARTALKNNGVIIVTRDLDESLELANKIAPEHLELVLKNPKAHIRKIKNAGTILVNTPEAIGDYIAGPSHVLPTGGTARFSSGLSIDDFLKKTNVIFFTKRRLVEIGPYAMRLAYIEGLEGHLLSIAERLKDEQKVRY